MRPRREELQYEINSRRRFGGVRINSTSFWTSTKRVYERFLFSAYHHWIFYGRLCENETFFNIDLPYSREFKYINENEDLFKILFIIFNFKLGIEIPMKATFLCRNTFRTLTILNFINSVHASFILFSFFLDEIKNLVAEVQSLNVGLTKWKFINDENDLDDRKFSNSKI